jgi:glucose-6-phosphate dehydrogenase assembly protein OpcA
MADTTPQTEKDEAAGTIDTGAPVPVSIDYVGLQLSELWRDVAEAAQAKGGVQAVTMAQVLNLIARAGSYDAANSYRNDIAGITGRHPARVIATVADQSEGDMPVQAWVSIHCELPPGGGRQVCAEQVTVAAGGESVRQIPAAVIPLLIPDLPVFLWWPQGSPFDDYLFRNLAPNLNRLIVDSATFENPEGVTAKMPALMRSNWPKIAMTDMNWGRLTRWREMVASFFDGPTLRPYLDQIDTVTIDFALSQRGGINRVQPMLLAGWLASRLHWQPTEQAYQLASSDGQRPSAAVLKLRFGKRPITIKLNPGPYTSDVPGDIHRVRLEVHPQGGGKVQAAFEVTLVDEPDQCAATIAEVQGAEPVKRNIQLERPERSALLDDELEVFSHDAVYEEALDVVSAFIRGAPVAPKQDQGPRKITTGEPISAGAQRTKPPGERPR